MFNHMQTCAASFLLCCCCDSMVDDPILLQPGVRCYGWMVPTGDKHILRHVVDQTTDWSAAHGLECKSGFVLKYLCTDPPVPD